jgi:hypothetical protein
MADLSQAQAPQSAKIIVAAHSGAGKTGALASVANAGYELFILDFDNGLDPLYHFVLPEFKHNVHFVTLQDDTENTSGETIIKRADSFIRGMKLLANWDDGEKNYGPVVTWGPERVLVLDSLTFASIGALHLASIRNGQNKYRPQAIKGLGDPRQIIGEAQVLVEGMLADLHSNKVKCNVIVMSHITYEGPDTDMTGFPTTVGRKLSPNVPRYFNTMLYMEKVGNQRQIKLNHPGIPTKCPALIPETLPINTGLAQVIKAITKAPSPKEKIK